MGTVFFQEEAESNMSYRLAKDNENARSPGPLPEEWKQEGQQFLLLLMGAMRVKNLLRRCW